MRHRDALKRAVAIGGLGIVVVAFLVAVIVFNRPASASSNAGGVERSAAPSASPTGAASSAPSTHPAGTGQVRPASSGGGGPYTPLPGQPLSLSVPAVGLTAPVGAMVRPSSGAIDPPTSSSAYWISSYGTVGPGSDNTAYIAGHTCRGAGCQAVFEPFLDVPDSSTTVHAGDKVVVASPSGTWSYTVTGTEKYSKATIAADSKLWQKVPGRLVLVCCFQYKGGTSSQQNYIVYAQLDSGQQ